MYLPGHVFMIMCASVLCFQCYAFYASPGCIVTGKLEFKDFVADSVNFNVYAPSNNTIFKAHMTYNDQLCLHDSVIVSSQKITLQKNKRSGNIEKDEWTIPAQTADVWTDFTLLLVRSFQVTDARGQQLIPEDVTLDCQVTSVVISGGIFTSHCPAGRPTWVVREGRCASVSVPVNQQHWSKRITLTSGTPFLPTLAVAGIKFPLAWKDGDLAVRAEGSLLPPVMQHVVVLDYDSDKLQIFGECHLLDTETVAAPSADLQVCGGNSDTFLVVDTLVNTQWREASASSRACTVTDNLNFRDVVAKYINFAAYVRPTSTIFKAAMTCKCGSWLNSTLTVTRQSAVLQKKLKDGRTCKQQWTLLPPEAQDGWMEMTLKLGDEFQLSDAANRQWIPSDVLWECQVENIGISDGILMEHCPAGTPTWEVKQGKCVDVPLPSTDLAWTKIFTLTSGASFSPRFIVGGTEVILQWSNSGIVAGYDELAQLPPSRQHILQLKSSGRQNILEMMAGKRTLYSGTLLSPSSSVLICGNNFDKFSLIETSNLEQGKGQCSACSTESTSHTGLEVVALGSGLVGSLLVVVVLIICLVHQRYSTKPQREEDKRTKSHSLPGSNSLNSSQPQEIPTGEAALYLEPIPAPFRSVAPVFSQCTPHPPTRLPPVHPEKTYPVRPSPVYISRYRPASLCSSTGSTTSPEHIYEEVDDVLGMRTESADGIFLAGGVTTGCLGDAPAGGTVQASSDDYSD